MSCCFCCCSWLIPFVLLTFIIRQSCTSNITSSTTQLQLSEVNVTKPNYEDKNIPEWKQRACEKVKKSKRNSNYICDEKGDVKCKAGWQGDLCQVPMCRKSCDPMNGYCTQPGECRCHLGFDGENCDKCIRLPGCQHGYCNKPFECICESGWSGLFCSEPTGPQGYLGLRGYCQPSGECRCRMGWGGRACSECQVMPNCQYGTCKKPMECNCLPGYTGMYCHLAICSDDCNKQHGYCLKPGECRCKIGWTGANCDKCIPYPGWGGKMCDEELVYCDKHPNTCKNFGKCIPLSKDDGNFRCVCPDAYKGKRCELINEKFFTSTIASRITPPPPPPPSPSSAQMSSSTSEIPRMMETEKKSNSLSVVTTQKTPTSSGINSSSSPPTTNMQYSYIPLHLWPTTTAVNILSAEEIDRKTKKPIEKNVKISNDNDQMKDVSDDDVDNNADESGEDNEKDQLDREINET